MGSAKEDERERVEIDLLVEGIFRVYGCDFRDYAYASLRRRVWNVVRSEGLETVTQLLNRVLHDPDCMERFLAQLTVNVTSMFRDPSFFIAFREHVVPLLRAYPFIRIWHAGCSTGEEVYSMAILLHEEDLYRRCRLYATDLNEVALKTARDGIFPLEFMKEYEANYAAAGGKASLSDYFTAAEFDHVIFRQALRENMVFSRHNLATDNSFNEFHVILCRNVMIYFNSKLQARVHDLFYESLRRFGILALGQKESLKGTIREEKYEELDARERIYRRRD
jgi:chemotaxis protein methyltransferase CheR